MLPLLLMLGQVLFCSTGKASEQLEIELLEERRQRVSAGAGRAGPIRVGRGKWRTSLI